MFENEIRAITLKFGEAIEAGMATIKEALVAFMNAHPEVQSLRFRGYVPAFNDGDPCVFRLSGPAARIEGGNPDAGDDEDGYCEAYEFEYSSEDFKGKHAQLAADLRSLGRLLEESEGSAQRLFGPNFEATVGRDGVARIEEYDCEY